MGRKILEPGVYKSRWTQSPELIYVEKGGKIALTPEGKRLEIVYVGGGPGKIVKNEIEPASDKEVNEIRKKASQLIGFIGGLKK